MPAAVASDSFDHQEALLFRDLNNLIKDAQWLKHHVQLALEVQGSSLVKAGQSFGELPPLPALPAPSASEAVPAETPPYSPAPYSATPAKSSMNGSPAPSEARSPGPTGPPTPHRDPDAMAAEPPYLAKPQMAHRSDNPFTTL